MKMSDVLNEIRRRVGEENLTNSCSGRNCRVDMTDLPGNRIIADVDLAFEAHAGTGKHCDRILFYEHTAQNSLVVVLIEHKGGTFDSARDIAKQLQGGADFAKNFIPASIKTICIPVLFHGGGIHRTQRDQLKRLKVGLTQKQPISLGKCSAPKNLANVLSGTGNL